ncbi:amidohydrolase [Ruegeria litorea]|uniref:Amidohydrolase n=1 Tax=Falsiruegeria litorea TaxID=1280831 RepID=A0ABS5WW97_9RHOB|nr:amidohydrolase [Falsiruegeria litorea]MBT3143421.1 amidohydrolase [Falsiruegeria litorea]
MADITIFQARTIVTMNPSAPKATHVAVRDGRILGVGALSDLQGWGDYELNSQFANMTLMPGFVEGHAHAMEGTLWRHVYCGFFDRMDPNGKVWDGLKTLDDVLDRLKQAEAELTDPDAPLTGFQLDPIYMDNITVTRHDLDQVSATRPIGILHASGHILNVNTKALELAGMMRTGLNHPGIELGADGMSIGVLKSPEVYMPVGPIIGLDRAATDADEPGLRDFAKLCVRTGTTTVTDLASRLDDNAVEMMLRVTGEPTFPARVVPLKFFMGHTPEELISITLEHKKKSTDQLRLGRIKVIADGSIQGFSARLRWPGYHNGAPNGLWYIAPEQLSEIYHRALEADICVHTHTNGDQATDLALDMLSPALTAHPRPDHRFTLQHCQLADPAQFRRMKSLGMCVNLFANHHFYWGDEHYRLTVGPERAERMNACRTALDNDVPMTIHSDAPVTPLAPLFTAWCAVNRITASGRIQGEAEKISVEEALQAVTLGAAYTLHLDGEIGSIEVGKHADFAVLDADPTTCDPMTLKDIGVWGTVQGGRIFAAADL